MYVIEEKNGYFHLRLKYTDKLIDISANLNTVLSWLREYDPASYYSQDFTIVLSRKYSS